MTQRSFFTSRRKREAIAEGMLHVLDIQPAGPPPKPGFLARRINNKLAKIKTLSHEDKPKHQAIRILKKLQEKYPDAQVTIKQVAGKKVIEISLDDDHPTVQKKKVPHRTVISGKARRALSKATRPSPSKALKANRLRLHRLKKSDTELTYTFGSTTLKIKKEH